MRILHFSTTDIEGGAARAAYRLHTGFRALGHDSRMLVGHKFSIDTPIAATRANRVERLLDRVVTNVLERVGLQDVYYPSAWGFTNHAWVQDADIIQLHNVHGRFFSFPIISRLSKKTPVVWLLHDMWPLSGHCYYSYGCEKWKTGCGKCPLLLEDYLPLRYDTTALHWRMKQNVYNRSDLHIAAPSKWMSDLAEQSPLLGRFPIHHIPYGIDTDTFRPIEKAIARNILRIDPSSQVLLFSAHVVTTNPRKGGYWFQKALDILAQSELKGNILILIAGESESETPAFNDFPCQYLGYITSDYLMTVVYSAADVFVLPSLADNLPLSIIESMACGTPVVAFDVGGISELVCHMQSGYLAKYEDAGDLAAGIGLLLHNPEMKTAMGNRSRELAETRYSNELQVQQYIELYESILARSAEDQSRRNSTSVMRG